MAQEYYQYNKEQLLANPKLPLICMADNSQVFETMAKQMVEEIEDHNAKGEKTVFICPVGPVGQYPYLSLIHILPRIMIPFTHREAMLTG